MRERSVIWKSVMGRDQRNFMMGGGVFTVTLAEARLLHPAVCINNFLDAHLTCMHQNIN